ncbi:hypothetical protein [uncultured Roseobacter sp.]|uniref:hypothetical protein n=1 Tax=uncultured Roseobacter sp. TaxID=114847 RepID=UPI00261EF1CD|nr:hypothetical protein [uncultured Roseobacter sp.]
MSHRTEIMTAAGTLACALGIGFVMQSGDAAQQRYGDQVQVAHSGIVSVGQPADLRKDQVPESSVLDVHDITLTSAGIPQAEAAVAADPEPPATKTDTAQYTIRSACPTSARAETQPGAMVMLHLKAACLAGQTVTITHQNIVFDEIIGAEGTLSIAVPALTSDAVFSFSFENGKSIEAAGSVPTVGLYDRVLVQGVGDTGVQIHAREYGADYGDAGHVWQGSPRHVSALTDGNGGFVTVLGDARNKDRLMTEVYTYPAETSRAVDAVALSIETEVTLSNCGTHVDATAVRVSRGGLPVVRDLSIDVPSCDAVGDFLVLKNPLGDLKLASN